MNKHRAPRGFIALVSVVIIAAVLTALLFTLGVSSFLSRFNALDAENKRASFALAESCAEVALARLLSNVAYAPPEGGECIGAADACGEGPRVCVICTVTPGGEEVPKVVMTRAAVGGAYTNLEVTLMPTPGAASIIRARELPSYAGVSCAVPR